MNRLHYSPEALKDLEDIWDYTVAEFCDIDAAESIVDEITDTIDKLEGYAELGAVLSSFVNVQSEYRFLAVRKHKVFYRVEHEDIYIDRILHDKRNFMEIIFV